MENETNQVVQALAILSMTEAARERDCDIIIYASPETAVIVGRLCAAFGIKPPSLLARP